MIPYYLTLFILLTFGHFLADYPLQGDFLARAKNLVNPIAGVPWYQAMAAHCGIHAGFVFLITGSFLCTGIEFVFHFLIDVSKCEGKISYNIDQAMHVGTKIFLIILLLYPQFLII